MRVEAWWNATFLMVVNFAVLIINEVFSIKVIEWFYAN